MKYLFILLLGVITLSACGKKVAYTNAIRDEYGLDNVDAIKKVQFYTSQTIILEREKTSGNQGTSDDGTLVDNSNKTEDRVIIPMNTKCVFEKFGENGEVFLRFEVGVGKTLTFKTRQDLPTGKYYLVANWEMNKGGELEYGNETYTVPASAGNAYLNVVIRKLQKTKRKDRIVKGMKV